MSDPVREHWQQHIQAQRESGLSIKAYARRENLSVHMLYRWRTLLGQTRTQREPLSQALPGASAGFAQASFTAKEPTPSACRLVLGPGLHLEMAALPSPQWLLALGRAAQEAR